MEFPQAPASRHSPPRLSWTVDQRPPPAAGSSPAWTPGAPYSSRHTGSALEMVNEGRGRGQAWMSPCATVPALILLSLNTPKMGPEAPPHSLAETRNLRTTQTSGIRICTSRRAPAIPRQARTGEALLPDRKDGFPSGHVVPELLGARRGEPAKVIQQNVASWSQKPGLQVPSALHL